VASPGALKALYEALRSEQDKRARQRGQPVGDPREILYRELDEMHERLKQSPHYREPTPEERAAHIADLERYLAEVSRRQHGG